MPATEVRRLDKFINKAFLGKREIGRPMKYNIRNQGRTGWVELVFNPAPAFRSTFPTPSSSPTPTSSP